MIGRVISIDPAADARWERFVADYPVASVWHTAAWLAVLRQTYPFHPEHLAYEQDGDVHGVLPLFLVTSPLTGRRLVSLPFSGPSGPLGCTPAATGALVGAALSRGRALHCNYVNLQCRDDLQHLAGAGFAEERSFVCSILALDWEGDTPHFPRARTSRQEIGRGRRRGLQVEVTADPTALRAFYGLYLATGRHHGMPPQPFELFRNMWEAFSRRDAARMLLVQFQGRPVYAMLCLTHRDVITGVYSGADYSALHLHAARVGDWSMAEWGHARGYRSLDLVQSHVRNTGLRWYKRSLGANEVGVTHYYSPARGPTSVLREHLVGGSSRLGRALKFGVSRLPDPAFMALGRLAFPHVG